VTRAHDVDPESPRVAHAEGGGTSAAGEVVVPNAQGLHLRPATEFAKLALASGCRVRVVVPDGDADGASVLELAMLGVVQGTRLRITAEGSGADGVVRTLVDLVARGFSER
jgi:phosphotransferase system HPr (HPr) family protein